MIHRAKKAARAGLKIGHEHAQRHWERYGWLGAVGAALVILIVVQLAYPWQNLPLFASVEGMAVGGQSADKVVKLLDDKYAKTPIELYFGNSTKAYRQPLPSAIGLTVSSKPQVDAKVYNFWLRLVPSSLFWAHLVAPSVAPSYKHDAQKVGVFVQKELGESCNVTAQNASLRYKDKKLQVISAIDGGTCKLSDVEKQLNSVRPTLSKHTVRVPMVQHPAAVHDADAQKVADRLTARTASVSIKAGDGTVAVPQDAILSWLDFTAPDSGIVATVNTDRATDFFTKQLASKVTVKAGTSYITTLDFTIVSQSNGASGQALDTEKLVTLLNEWLAGTDTELIAPVRAVGPAAVYSRTYTATDTGLAALLEQFAQSHPGVFGVSYMELGGQGRHAGYNDTRIFETASTYKLFVAYGTLKRVQSGEWDWNNMQVTGGKKLAQCFDDMIVKSDNACAEALLSKIGYATLTNEIRAIGLTHSSFVKNYIQSTPADQATFLGALQSGQLFSDPWYTNTLLGAMKRNIYRQGIPAGASAAVADKVGFLYALLHDAAIVYSPSGTYVLVIMTDDSSWGTIADLTRKIEAWRAQ